MEKNKHFGGSKKKRILFLLILLFGMISWTISIYYKRNITDYYASVGVRYEEATLTKQKIQDAQDIMLSSLESDVPEVTLWQKADNTDIGNQALSTKLKVDLIIVAGDMSRVYPGHMVSGGYIFEDDYMGCVIDSKTAYALYHTKDVVGMPIQYNNKEYIVRGVIELVECSTMLIQSDDTGLTYDNKNKYNCMELVFTDSENAISLAENFVINYDLGSPSTYINGYLYQNLADRIVLFPAWFFALWVMYICICRVYALRGSIVIVAISSIFVFILSILLVKLVDFHIYFPATLIPNKWSDFEFWVNQWKNIKASIREMDSSVYYKDTMLRKSFYYVVSGAALAVISEGILLNSITNRNYL